VAVGGQAFRWSGRSGVQGLGRCAAIVSYSPNLARTARKAASALGLLHARSRPFCTFPSLLPPSPPCRPFPITASTESIHPRVARPFDEGELRAVEKFTEVFNASLSTYCCGGVLEVGVNEIELNYKSGFASDRTAE